MNKRLFTILIIVLFLLANMATLAVSNPVQVWVDDDYTDTNSGEHTWGVDAFATIQEGIDAVEEGGTVNVAAGIYTDDIWDSGLGVPEGYRIKKSVTLLGAHSGNDPEGSLDRGEESVLVRTNGVPYSLYVSNITIDGFTFTSGGGSGGGRLIVGDASDHTIITNCILKDISGTDPHGIYVYPGAQNTLISQNTLSNTGWEALNIDGAAIISGNVIKDISSNKGIRIGTASNATVTENIISNAFYEGIASFGSATITDNEISGCYHGIQLRGNATFYTVSGNNIHDNQYHGIEVPNYTGEVVASANITNNTLADNPYCGIKLGGNTNGVNYHINDNIIKGNGIYGVESATTEKVDATQNWWGDTSGPYHDDTNLIGVGNSVSDNVNYDPWYSDEDMTQLVSNKLVYNSSQETFYNTIQDAINNADNGDIIELSTGTYDYQSEGEPSPAGLLKITKPLTIKAASGALPVIDGSGFDGVFKIHPSALTPGGQVVIEGLNITGDSVTDIAITMQGCFDGIPAQVIIRDNQIHGMNGGIDFWGAGAYLPSGWTSAVAGIEITGNQFYDLGQDSNGFGVMLEDLANWTTAGNSYAAVVDGNNFNNINDSGTDPAIGIIIPRANDAHEAVNTHIANNDFSNISVDIAITDGDVSDTTIVDNNFGSGGTGIFVENISNGPVDATQNWWGDEIGPYNVNTNPEGLGDEVSDNVLYYHWYADNSFTTLYSANAITLTKTGPDTAKKGDEITYQLNYKNEGNFVETNVVITETYPSEVDFVSSNPDPDSGTNNKWTFGKLEAGDEGTIEVTVKIK